MRKSLYLLSFAVGALAGSAASYFILKKRFAKIAQEEIDSVKEAFSYKQGEAIAEAAKEPEVVADEKEAELKNYNTILTETNYGGDNIVKKNPSYIRIISPVELGEDECYKIVGLTYYADEVLADDEGNVINVDDTIGAESLKYFGEYDDGAVHVRNMKLETDYEVLLDERDYSEVFK